MTRSASLAERLFGPIDRRLTGPDSDGFYVASVTPPAMLRLPTAFVKLDLDQATRYMDWYVNGGLLQDKLADLSPSQRETLLNGCADFEDCLGGTAADRSTSTHGGSQ